jgi:hypothetical protein
MRTQFFFVGLLSVVAGGLVGTAGCDNITAGQPSDTKAPPQLVHVLVQDARYVLQGPNRASALDVIDNQGQFANFPCTITTPATSTSAQLSTCINEFLVDQVAPPIECTAAGTCSDVFKIPDTGVPIPLSVDLLTGADDMRDPGGGVQVRLVFDKVLDASIETVTMDPTQAPGKTNTYKLMAGLIELDDESGMAVPSTNYYDNGGSANFSADLELVPLGPALVIKPNQPLDPHTTYTVKIGNPGALKDREGNQAVTLGGGALATTYTFTTEDLTPTAAGAFGPFGFDYPADFSTPPAITPNEVIQIGFFGLIAGDSATVAIKSGCTGAKLIAYSDRLNDPTMCPTAASGDPSGFVLAITNTDTGDIATGLPVDWPMGDCTITVTVPPLDGKGASYTADYSFTVAGTDETDPSVDPNIQSQHVTPAQCMM